MSSLWNLLSPVRSGAIKVAGSGNQLFGTVVKHGLNDKTVTVRVSAQNWNNKYKRYLHSHKNKLVHDELNYCVSGDKVVIKNCAKLTPLKHYYVKNIIKPFPRDELDPRFSGRVKEQKQAEEPIIEPPTKK